MNAIKVRFGVAVCSTSDNTYRFTATFETELPFVPTADTLFSIQPLTSEGSRTPERVEYNVDEAEFYVFFGMDDRPTKKDCESLRQHYEDFNWSIG